MVSFLDEIRKIEKKWQKKWQEDEIFVANVDNSKPKWFLTVSYPYATSPLHIGHARTYGLGDIFARYKRQKGYNVLWPMGFHITGTPVLAVSWKIKNNEEDEWKKMRRFISNYESTKERIEEVVASFAEPENVANYFAEKIILDFLGMGYSLDTTREFSTGDPEYNKFIEWQYSILNDQGLIAQGDYPILWCVNDKNAVGEDDIQDGDELNVEVNEFVGIKFKLDNGIFLVAATLRPETIFGATNVWIHPEATYNEISIDRETWIVSKEATMKLLEQNHEIKINRELKGEELIDKIVEVPITGMKIPVYPATFVDTNHATGVVYSVPGHAPYDYAAIADLQKDEVTIEKYNLNSDVLKQIEPISLIEVKGYGEFPAVEICQKLGVKSQDDIDKLEEATQTIYKDEYYSGVMKNNTGDYVGLKVEEAKNRVADTLFDINLAAPIYEPSTKAFCRCGGQIIVAVIQNQYFLNYGNPEWKKKAFKALNQMIITPDKYRLSFENTFDWLDKRPCVRRRGLGTEFPFTKGEGWIIESLSDSVIYMAYYTIVRYIKDIIPPEKLTPELFNYVFLSKGNGKEVSKNTGIEEEILNQMKNEFEYWYPNDLRHTAVHHISNHLSFAIFHHATVFPEKYWLPAFSLNEMLSRDGEAMSKSKPNVIPIAQVPNKYSVDLTRLHLASIATPETVLDWKEEEVKFALQRLRKFWNYGNEASKIEMKKIERYSEESRDLLIMINTNLKNAIDFLENYNARDYILNAFFNNLKEIDDYNRKVGSISEDERNNVLKLIMENLIVFLAPVIPHICEEINERMGNKNYISLQNIPYIEKIEERLVDTDIRKIGYDDRQVSVDVEQVSITDRKFSIFVVNKDQRDFAFKLIEDIEEIVKLLGKNPKKIHIYINAPWKNELFKLANEIFEDEAVNIGRLMSATKEHPILSKYMKEIANEAKLMLKDPTIFRIKMLSSEDQKIAIEGYQQRISTTFGNADVKFYITDEEGIYDPQNKSQKARPMKPALLLE